MKNTIQKSFFLVVFCFAIIFNSTGERLDFSNASIYYIKKDNSRIANYVKVLQEEINKRSGVTLPQAKKIKKLKTAVFIIALESEVGDLPENFKAKINEMANIGQEGFKLALLPEEKVILVIGYDERGVLYGIGHLLRKMEIRQGSILVPENLALATTPRYSIRGHQLGYRPKTNAYDAWSPAQFDQYIRELAIFGANCIEIMPPRTDDDFTSEHMQIPAMDMIAEQSRSCDNYGLDVWMWYPNMGSNYIHPDSIRKELKERQKVFSSIQRLDVLFVPGGDPGDLEPDILFNWLKEVASVMIQYHPQAKIWVSPQVFRPTKEWFDVFYSEVNKSYPWFGGVVFGPWVKTPIQQIRRIVRPDIPIRRYPDITHSLSAQYPIPKWDLAQAMTLGRECINPRPIDQKAIHNTLDEYAEGSLSYSEGTNDDLNKFVWSDQDWDPERPVIETLRDYARLFIGPDYIEEVAQGLMALERNVQGPLLVNDQVERTLQQWQGIEAKASEEVMKNFRFQMGLIRAYFDAYIQLRLIRETAFEQEAKMVLANARSNGTRTAIDRARQILDMPNNLPAHQDYKKRCNELADDLFSSIGAQLTIEKHGAMGGRGNFIDNIDVPLNDAIWMMATLDYILTLDSEEEKLEAIDNMLHRTDPGPGGFYDNFGTPNSWNRVKVDKSWAEDPGSLHSPRVSFGVGLKGREWVHEITAKGFEGRATPLAWAHQVTTLYDEPLEIVYDNLDPESSYAVRIAYTGRFRSRMKMIADGNHLIHDFIKTGEQPMYEFPIPAAAISDGTVTFSWTCGEGERGAQVSEIWIIRKAPNDK